jgi:hypothetical protein
MRTSPNKTPSLLVITACLATGCAAHAPPTSTPAIRDKTISIDLNRIVFVFAEENPYPSDGAILSGTTLSHIGAGFLSRPAKGSVRIGRHVSLTLLRCPSFRFDGFPRFTPCNSGFTC